MTRKRTTDSWWLALVSMAACATEPDVDSRHEDCPSAPKRSATATVESPSPVEPTGLIHLNVPRLSARVIRIELPMVALRIEEQAPGSEITTPLVLAVFDSDRYLGDVALVTRIDDVLLCRIVSVRGRPLRVGDEAIRVPW